ncbi:hypothetical protein JI58_05145 [Marinosulfonomonas sp. PRT-SC04]|nr:hypothetical protein JI58_07175 [Marinosulfonomonas sp. PRT-SC04]KPU84226.1 hypothetical protein JI58_05145 [Marinosulfonomonas sp. PRT-SC04]
MNEFLTVLGRSEFSDPDVPLWFLSSAIQGCHILIGCALAHRWVPTWIAVAVFSGWLGKELFADIVNSNFSQAVLLDSAADLLFGWLGFIIVRASRGGRAR